MSEQARLGTAIRTISERYLGRVLDHGDTSGILKWSLRLADYSTRLAASVAPPLEPAEAADTTPPEPLSMDFNVARAQILASIGHPEQVNELGQAVYVDPAAVIKDVTPQQNRELALLRVFGSPDHPAVEGVDWLLWLRYYAPRPDGSGWVPKPEYDQWPLGPWQFYLRGPTGK